MTCLIRRDSQSIPFARATGERGSNHSLTWSDSRTDRGGFAVLWPIISGQGFGKYVFSFTRIPLKQNISFNKPPLSEICVYISVRQSACLMFVSSSYWQRLFEMLICCVFFLVTIIGRDTHWSFWWPQQQNKLKYLFIQYCSTLRYLWKHKVNYITSDTSR